MIYNNVNIYYMQYIQLYEKKNYRMYIRKLNISDEMNFHIRN